jgi:hypothetical protein
LIPNAKSIFQNRRSLVAIRVGNRLIHDPPCQH